MLQGVSCVIGFAIRICDGVSRRAYVVWDALRTFQHLHGENSRHQLGPAVIARMRLFFFGAVSMSAGFRVRRWRRDGDDGGALFRR